MKGKTSPCCATFILAILIIAVGQNSAYSQETQNIGTRTLYLIRHGDYDHEDRRDPDIGRGLVPLGIAQTRLVADRLRSLPDKMTSLHSSTMTRARQTAMIINQDFPNLELQQSRILRECTPPTWREDIMARSDSTRMSACSAQFEEAFAQYFVPSEDSTDRHDVLVCHGNVIRYFVTRSLRVDTLSWLQMSIGNCSLTIIRVRADGSTQLVAYSDVGHLPANLQTRTGGENEAKKLTLPEEIEN